MPSTPENQDEFLKAVLAYLRFCQDIHDVVVGREPGMRFWSKTDSAAKWERERQLRRLAKQLELSKKDRGRIWQEARDLYAPTRRTLNPTTQTLGKAHRKSA